jgi:hypothetical protein
MPGDGAIIFSDLTGKLDVPEVVIPQDGFIVAMYDADAWRLATIEPCLTSAGTFAKGRKSGSAETCP